MEEKKIEKVRFYVLELFGGPYSGAFWYYCPTQRSAALAFGRRYCKKYDNELTGHCSFWLSAILEDFSKVYIVR